jgi:ketosteroid isomerase-like protein
LAHSPSATEILAIDHPRLPAEPDALGASSSLTGANTLTSLKQMWETVAQQMGLKDVRLQTLDFEQAGDTGYEVGEATLALAGGTAVVKFVVAWKKTDGQWRLHRDIWNTKGP